MNINARYQQIKKLFAPKYNPKTHWVEWGKKVKSDDIFIKRPHKLEMKMLRVNALLKLLDTLEFKSVLDFGCGWGFVSKFLLEKYSIDNYVAFDASPNRVEDAKEYLIDYSVEFHTSMIEDFKANKKFDLVLGTGVLHHVPPDNIKSVLKHLLGLTGKYLIHDDPPPGYREDQKIDKTTFNFFHKYKEIYHELGYDVDIIPIPNHPSRTIYCVKVN